MDNMSNTNQGYYAPNDLRNVIRLLWIENIMWLRFYIVSELSNLKDIEVITNRLLQSPIDFAKVLRIYYGDNTANDFENLFRTYLQLTIQYIITYKKTEPNSSNSLELTTIENMWYDSANQIALFLSKINSKWDTQILRTAFYNQINMIKDEVKKRYYGQYAADVDAFDNLEYHTLMIADIMALGIMNQFYSTSK